MTVPVPAPDEHRLVEHFAHDLRAPLISVLGFSDVLREQLGDAATRERAAEAIGRNARRLERVIDELVETSAVLAGRARLEPARVDLVELIASVVADLADESSAKGVELGGADLAGELWSSGDRRHLRRILRSVLSESVQACAPRGCVTIDLVADDDPTGAHRDAAVALVVRSTCTARPRSRVRDAPPTDRELDRAALARTVVERLVELHGGSIRAEATASGDTRTVVITLPLHRSVA